MSHEVETMAYANEVPWHGLGVQVSDNLTPAQMLEAAGLDWKVEKKALVVSVSMTGNSNSRSFTRASDSS